MAFGSGWPGYVAGRTAYTGTAYRHARLCRHKIEHTDRHAKALSIMRA